MQSTWDGCNELEYEFSRAALGNGLPRDGGVPDVVGGVRDWVCVREQAQGTTGDGIVRADCRGRVQRDVVAVFGGEPTSGVGVGPGEVFLRTRLPPGLLGGVGGIRSGPAGAR